jgi:Gram-negative bacterial TonB protein C-terminal
MENGKWKMENVGIGIFRFLIFFGQYLFSIFHFPFSIFLLAACCMPLTICAQKIAVLTPEKNEVSKIFAVKFADSFSENVKIIDSSLSDAAYRAQSFEKPFNITLSEAKNIGAAIGCDYFLLAKSENIRRNSLSKGEYYESYAVVFTVSTRTGKLVFWKLNSFEAEKKDVAEKKLFDSASALAAEISGKIKVISKEELNEKIAPDLERLPEENSAEAKNFRPPLPYKRMRPAYTRLANFYSIEATVDVEIDVDETGKILQIETVRWAGFGLDESVAANVRRMNWRPATRAGKNLPMRVLLRYNFKKLEAE